MEKLIEYYMRQTDQRFAELRADLKDSIEPIKTSLEDLQKFKVEMMVSAKWTSMLVSAVCGFVTMVVSAYLSYKIAGKP